ncbi:FAD-binding domain-containing protein [Cognatishimia sp. MH4019]|uniref:FAD-binding domain-containing protein n=1 Tax=Cognatishimia sp. MH4019 TaxID=2854030 RepID=UPI001CD5C2AC|nr:FAD-binding domain-containing protein [Cognatishimia sp. MH4019]
MQPAFTPTRTAALERLQAFVPKTSAYASKRNYDLEGHPHVSGLSPYIRHRMVTEQEVLEAVLGRYALSTAEKFVQEVYWRTYWKGWLEMRPSVWTSYRAGVQGALNRVQTEAGLRAAWEEACRGETDIAAFNHWAQELVETGYLHNHARMWFASIWIFTLRLPWELGADFFLRHLIDGDPASNTLGWRWVAGLQTKGKTYLARPSNIARYTEGRFNPEGELSSFAEPLDGDPHPDRINPPMPESWDRTAPTGLLLTEEDMSPGYILGSSFKPATTAALLCTDKRSPLATSPVVENFTAAAMDDCLVRYKESFNDSKGLLPNLDAIENWAAKAGIVQIVTPYAPVGPTAETLSELARRLQPKGITLIRALRDFDTEAWPHATHGFFRFKEKIPKLVGRLKGLKAA